MENKLTALAAIVLLAGFAPSLSAQTEAEAAKIEWISFEEAVKRNQTEPRKLFIDVYTDWCGWCKRMDAGTFQDPEIAKAINAHFYAVKLDAEQKEKIVFRGQDFEYVPSGRRGYHELAASLLQGQMSYPSFVVLNQDYGILQVLKGYQKEQQLHPILLYIGQGLYDKDVKWEEYVSTAYASPY